MPSSGLLTGKNIQPDADSNTLSQEYGITMATLLPRDPDWMFIYWEITGNSKTRITRDHGSDVFEKSRQVLRVYDTAATGDGNSRYFDVPVMLDAGNWYIRIQDAGRTYCCELGLVLPSGGFVGIVKSNTVSLPAGRISDVTDERRMAVSADFDRLLQISGVEYIGKGSGEVAKSLAQRWEMLRSAVSKATSWGVSSLSSRAPRLQKKFWLAADCELILYGATEPDAFVTVAGRKVKLNPDGTFSMRFAFPDGSMDMPVKAVPKDETDSREIGISMTRIASQ